MLKDHRYKAKSISLIFLNSHTNESFTFILFSFSRRQVWYSLVIFSFEEWTCEHMCVCLRSATHKQSSRPQSCNYPKLRQSVRYHNPPFSVTETRRSSQICTADLSLKPTHLTFIRHFMNGTGVKFQGLTKRYLFVHFSPLQVWLWQSRCQDNKGKTTFRYLLFTFGWNKLICSPAGLNY